MKAKLYGKKKLLAKRKWEAQKKVCVWGRQGGREGKEKIKEKILGTPVNGR